MFIKVLSEKLLNLSFRIFSGENNLQEKPVANSYICVYLDTDNQKLEIPLQEYFDGSSTKELSEYVRFASQGDTPIRDNLYDAYMYLGRHGRGGDESRYILVLSCDKDTALQLLEKKDDHFHEKIVYAINWSTLITAYQKTYTNFLPSKSTFELVMDDEEPSEGRGWRAEQPAHPAVEPFVGATSLDVADAGRLRPSAEGGHTSAETEGERATCTSRFASRRPALAGNQVKICDNPNIKIVYPVSTPITTPATTEQSQNTCSIM